MCSSYMCLNTMQQVHSPFSGLCFFECVAVAQMYGGGQYCNNLECTCMLGFTNSPWLRICCTVLTPIIMWLGLYPARGQILERRSWVCPNIQLTENKVPQSSASSCPRTKFFSHQGLLPRQYKDVSRITILRELSFFTGRGGPSVCDRGSSIFSGPPFSHGKKKFGPPCWPMQKILAPPFGFRKKFWPPQRRTLFS